MSSLSKSDAEKLISFKNSCMCGGHANSMNGRNPRRPHMDWCPQKEEYDKWYDALYPLDERIGMDL